MEINLIDDHQITLLICVRLRDLLYDFFFGGGGVVPFIAEKQQEGGPKHNAQKSYSECFRRTQIR